MIRELWERWQRGLSRNLLARTPPRLRRRVIRNRRLLFFAGFSAFGLVLLLLWWWLFASRWVVTNDAYVTGNLVPVKSQVTGTVVEVRYENTQFVRQGAMLVRLDGLDSRVALEGAEARLGEAVRRVEALFSQVMLDRQRILAQSARLERLRHDLVRYRAVASYGAIPAQQVDDTECQIRELEATVREVEADWQAAEAQIRRTTVESHPQVLEAASALKKAYLDYVRREVQAPVSGFVANRRVQPGDEVHPDTPLMAVVPLDYLWVEANYRERELRRIRPGQSVRISIDLYGHRRRYHGVVEGIGAGTGSVFGLLPPENATGNYIHIVERVPVRIRLSEKEVRANPLRPGLSAVTAIHVSERGISVLESLARFPKEKYEAPFYEQQLGGAEEKIQAIIAANRRHPRASTEGLQERREPSGTQAPAAPSPVQP
ncbi:putative multidrug resistance protein EmrK [Methylacidimicrobium cyclopophantes]|uniref:Multidrug resistance protein EmrK n=1 Tax=Methylacidimicrobium cyclopophantes TaxID=1041766 RepID=A0A5E6MIU9_9BACT|nr:HlyD family efflux transporter periplasmic adaptor subunit [Methylacidimicrobium cyclopophantes]VVM07874.1 putative multidrug resistance protein EmrK [Methylacidimicrobium cyclopophantes]